MTVQTASAAIARTVSGSNLIARLTPLKRILCMCPVEVLVDAKDNHNGNKDDDDRNDNRNNNINVQFQLGMAISDPYLSRAERVNHHLQPLIMTMTMDLQTQQQMQQIQFISTITKSFPDGSALDAADVLDPIGYSDVGGILLALPMKLPQHKNNNNDNSSVENRPEDSVVVLEAVSDCLESLFLSHCLLNDAKKSMGSCLICRIKDPIFLQDALEMARNDPDMFEEVDLVADEGTNSSSSCSDFHPNVHAGVALTQFLWKHTGGWQNNTFG